jgi:hypothetical protein
MIPSYSVREGGYGTRTLVGPEPSEHRALGVARTGSTEMRVTVGLHMTTYRQDPKR